MLRLAFVSHSPSVITQSPTFKTINKIVLDTILRQQLGIEKSGRIHSWKEMLVNRKCRIKVTLCEEKLLAVGQNGPTLSRPRIGYNWVSL
jgi:hypothetical protein